MSHLVYKNLAPLPGFNRDLNYTGIILDNWDDPLHLIHVVLIVLCLLTGLPKGFLAWWVFINTAIIHPMDFIVGAMGRGFKYMSDEYAIMDTRYWPTDDPAITWISYMELVIYVPLCYAWYHGIVKDKWYKHYFALVASTFQLMGCIIYLGAEWHVGFVHLPTHDWTWPPTFDSYLKLKYFWLIFVGCNCVWITIPMYVYYCTFRDLSKLFSKEKTQ